MRRRACVLLALTCFAAHAWDGGYSPGFEPLPSVRRFPVRACEAAPSSTRSQDVFVYRGESGQEWRMEMSRADEAVISLSTRQTLLASSRVKEDIPPYLQELYAADLNGDGLPDFAAVFPGGGSGLASEYCFVAFFLSSPHAYEIVSIRTMGFGKRDFMDFYGDETCQIAHRAFVYGEPGKDGRTHNYWVYHFLGIEGTSVRLLDGLPARWILYAGRSNHRDTRQLSGEQKERLWRDAGEQVFVGLGD